MHLLASCSDTQFTKHGSGDTQPCTTVKQTHRATGLRRRPSELELPEPPAAAAASMTGMSVFWGSSPSASFLGTTTVSTPFSTLALILLGSTLSGSWKRRMNLPNTRSTLH